MNAPQPLIMLEVITSQRTTPVATYTGNLRSSDPAIRLRKNVKRPVWRSGFKMNHHEPNLLPRYRALISALAKATGTRKSENFNLFVRD